MTEEYFVEVHYIKELASGQSVRSFFVDERNLAKLRKGYVNNILFIIDTDGIERGFPIDNIGYIEIEKREISDEKIINTNSPTLSTHQTVIKLFDP